MAKHQFNLKSFAKKWKNVLRHTLKGGDNFFYSENMEIHWFHVGLLVLSIVLIILFILYLIGVFSDKESGDCSSDRGCLLLSEPKNTKVPYVIESDNLPGDNAGVGYTLSVWLYVDSENFDKQSQKYKSVLYRGTSKSYNGFVDNQFTVQPGIWLYGATNKLLIRWNTSGRVSNVVNCKTLSNPCTRGNRCRDSDNSIKVCNKDRKLVNENTSMYSMNPYINPPNKLCSGVETQSDILWNTSDVNTDNETCIDNIPLDRWFQLSLVMHNQSIDIYVDGKLYSTFVLNSLPNQSNDSNLVLSMDNSPFYQNLNGFYGAINQLRYFDRPLTPQEILKVYSMGPNPYVHQHSKLGNSSKDKGQNDTDRSDENYLGSDNY